jgi:hypothetical protein
MLFFLTMAELKTVPSSGLKSLGSWNHTLHQSKNLPDLLAMLFVYSLVTLDYFPIRPRAIHLQAPIHTLQLLRPHNSLMVAYHHQVYHCFNQYLCK